MQISDETFMAFKTGDTGGSQPHASSNNLTYKLRSQRLIFTQCGCCAKEGIVRLLLLNSFLTTITLFAVAVLAHGQGGSPQSSDTLTTPIRMIRIPAASGARVISKTGASLVFESSGVSPRMAASGLAERSSAPTAERYTSAR